ncbi:MAG: GntR family transcriptional regulator [Pseudomonadota bacterium]
MTHANHIATDDGQPRYVRLANTLRRAITDGKYPVGARLPTEMELCAAHKVSRFTAREALRTLREAGLIQRRRGAGTVVVAEAAPAAFHQPLGGVDDLLQYAEAARLDMTNYGPAAPDEETASALGLSRHADYVKVTGLRRSADAAPPIGHTEIYVRADIAPSRATMKNLSGAIISHVEEATGLNLARIEQEISGASLPADIAATLAAEPGTPALRTLRRFYDDKDRLLVASDTLHPAGRFVYRQTVMRAKD